MTLQQLRYLVVLAEETHFADAARRCGITQPTLSTMISRLEDELGELLFDRSSRPLRITETGQIILRQARLVLAEAEKIKSLIAESRESLEGPLRIGVLPTIAPYLLPLFLSRFSEQYPGLHLSIQELKTAELEQHLRNQSIDIAIAATPHAAITDELLTLPLYSECFFVYARHPPKKAYVLAEDISPDELWVLEEGHCFGEQVLALCALHRAHSRIDYASGSIYTLKRLVEVQGGVTVLPRLATLDMSEEELQRLRPFADPPPKRDISLVLRHDFARQRVLEVLQQSIQAAVAPHLQMPAFNKSTTSATLS